MTYQEALTLIKYIRATKYQLNDWEQQFIDDIERRGLDILTFKQHMALEKIYGKATGGSTYITRQRIR